MTAGEVMTRMRFHLNDTPAQYFTDTILLEPLNVALDDLRGELIDNNVPITNGSISNIIIPAGVTSLTTATTPAIPTGLVEIQQILERDVGSNDVYIPMTRVEFLPTGMPVTTQLIYWMYANQGIFFIGANAPREIKLEMIVDIIPAVIGAASVINIIRSMPFLAYRGAALAAENLGEDAERAAALNNNAGRELDKLINFSVKGKQVMPARRRPFQGSNYNSGNYY